MQSQTALMLLIVSLPFNENAPTAEGKPGAPSAPASIVTPSIENASNDTLHPTRMIRL